MSIAHVQTLLNPCLSAAGKLQFNTKRARETKLIVKDCDTWKPVLLNFHRYCERQTKMNNIYFATKKSHTHVYPHA